MSSPFRQLVDEIAWEGDARKYRGGGIGRENVLTAEVFQLLDLLPRSQYLGPVLDDAQGGADGHGKGLGTDPEGLTVSVLPGNLTTDGLQVRVQPDVLITSDSLFVLVDAKAVRRASFPPQQLAREVLVARDRAEGRRAVHLLVLGAPPPVQVRGLGPLQMQDALAVGLDLLEDRVPDRSTDGVEMLWTTWEAIAHRVATSQGMFTNADPSVVWSVHRMGAALRTAIDLHS
ncbi:hypothetical protein ACI3ET_01200 [Ornithinimicrobium sp. LYQ121]|uniref:hypothetical protein n=1 Tax=Ornithinimicrobium sp. LYQ121 TaxID=3378801 RepID=UPI0038543176